jgi:hypothetical protein
VTDLDDSNQHILRDKVTDLDDSNQHILSDISVQML